MSLTSQEDTQRDYYYAQIFLSTIISQANFTKPMKVENSGNIPHEYHENLSAKQKYALRPIGEQDEDLLPAHFFPSFQTHINTLLHVYVDKHTLT